MLTCKCEHIAFYIKAQFMGVYKVHGAANENNENLMKI